MTTIMVTSAGRRRYVLEELVKYARASDTIIATDMSPLAAALSTPGVRPMLVEGDSLEERSHAILRIAEHEQVDALLSLHDYEAINLSGNASLFESFGCRFIGPTVDTSQLTLDKLALAHHLESIDPSLSPRTYHQLEALRAAAGDAPHWVVKDRWGSASSGLAFHDTDSVAAWAAELSPDTWVAQPLEEGVEYNVDIFLDANGSVAGSCAKRKWAMRGGETDSATVLLDPPKQVLDAATRCASRLDVTGNIDIDVILGTDGTPVVIDVNPRFGGGYAFSAMAGYKAAEAVWQLARREAVSELAPEREVTAAKHVAVAEVRNP